MGFLSRILPFLATPAERVEKARKLVDSGEFNDARWELEGVDAPGAEQVRALAMAGLVEHNLAEARALLTAGENDQAREHMQLAQQFGATSDQMKEVRRYAREVREEARIKAELAEAEANRFDPEGDDPIWSLPPDDPRLRFAMQVEAYPEGLRERVLELGGDFALVAASIESGEAAQALEALGRFVEIDPVARYERARAALALGRMPSAASDLLAFGQEVGHARIGSTHTAVMAVQVLLQLKRGEEALEVLADQPAEPELDFVRAEVLAALGRFDEAEPIAVQVAKVLPKTQPAWRLLASIRLARGNRPGAAAALEACLTNTCCSPGKCGNQPYDVEAGRLLARLYLEDRAEPERVAEILKDLASNVQKPTWDDLYLQALVARNGGDPTVGELAGRLRAGLPDGDPRQAVIREAFAG